jgi:hypothetical protein
VTEIDVALTRALALATNVCVFVPDVRTIESPFETAELNAVVGSEVIGAPVLRAELKVALTSWMVN